MKQQSLFKKEKTEFGGSHLKNKRKTQRPLSIKTPIFLTIKGDISKSGSLLKQRNFLDLELRKWAQRYGIRIYDHSICYDHIHACIEVSTVEGYKNFVRTFNGRTAQSLQVKWIYRPHTELVKKGRHLQNVLNYIVQNHEEAIGLRAYKPRKRHQKNVA